MPNSLGRRSEVRFKTSSRQTDGYIHDAKVPEVQAAASLRELRFSFGSSHNCPRGAEPARIVFEKWEKEENEDENTKTAF